MLVAWLAFKGTIFTQLRRPGDHGHLRDVRPISFAPPVFTGFAIIGLQI